MVEQISFDEKDTIGFKAKEEVSKSPLKNPA